MRSAEQAFYGTPPTPVDNGFLLSQTRAGAIAGPPRSVCNLPSIVCWCLHLVAAVCDDVRRYFQSPGQSNRSTANKLAVAGRVTARAAALPVGPLSGREPRNRGCGGENIKQSLRDSHWGRSLLSS